MKEPGAIKLFFMVIYWAWKILVDTKEPILPMEWAVYHLRTLHFKNRKEPRKKKVKMISLQEPENL